MYHTKLTTSILQLYKFFHLTMQLQNLIFYFIISSSTIKPSKIIKIIANSSSNIRSHLLLTSKSSIPVIFIWVRPHTRYFIAIQPNPYHKSEFNQLRIRAHTINQNSHFSAFIQKFHQQLSPDTFARGEDRQRREIGQVGQKLIHFRFRNLRIFISNATSVYHIQYSQYGQILHQQHFLDFPEHLSS